MDSLASLGKANVAVSSTKNTFVLIIVAIIAFIGLFMIYKGFRAPKITQEEKDNASSKKKLGAVLLVIALVIFAFVQVSQSYNRGVQSNSALASLEGANAIGGFLKGLI
jgi:uncharacterized membrane protein